MESILVSQLNMILFAGMFDESNVIPLEEKLTFPCPAGVSESSIVNLVVTYSYSSIVARLTLISTCIHSFFKNCDKMKYDKMKQKLSC